MAKKESKPPEWETRAKEVAKALGLPETEVIEQTKAAIVRKVADRIAEDELKKWLEGLRPPFYATGMPPKAGEMKKITL